MDAWIVGVGQTEYSRASGRPEAQLVAEAVTDAVADAGITLADIDGVVPYPDGPSAEDVIAAFGLSNVRFTSTPHLGGASSVAALQLARMAITTGTARVVVCAFARNGSSRRRIQNRVSSIVPGQRFRRSLEAPFGLSTPAQWYSLICRRHMHEFGTTREQLGEVAVVMRQHAQQNPAAQTHGRTLSMEDYLKSPPVALPYVLHDCCLETDGGCVVIVASSDVAAGCCRVPVRLAGVAEGHPNSPDDLANRRPFFDTGLRSAAPRALAQAGVGVGDLDAAMIYDCFTFEVIHQLEEAGFCARGEGGAFVAEGNIAYGGSLPVNTHGGLLSEGHLGGMNHIVEAARQLRGDCGSRQLHSAEVIAVTGWGDLGDGTMAVLVRDGLASAW